VKKRTEGVLLAVSPTEAAKMLGIGRNLVYLLIKQGDIPAIRLGERRILVPVEGLKQLLKQEPKD